MSNLSVFQFHDSHTVRILLDENGTPLFVAKDVALALGYSDTVNAIKQHCKGVVKHHPIQDSLNRTQNIRVIYEPDVYRLIFGSKLESATKFQDWVFNEVLPTIRKTGSYTLPAKTEYNGTPLSRDQVIIINNLLHNIRYCFNCQEQANQAVQNRLRVDLRLRTMQDLRAQHFEQAKAILEDIHQHAKAYQAWRNTAENQAIEHLIHDGRPWTPTLVGKLKKQLGLTVGNYPDWHKLADTLNAAVKGA